MSRQQPKVWRDLSKAHTVFENGQQITDRKGTTWQITVKEKWVSGEAISYKGSDKPEWTQGVLAFLWGLVEKPKPMKKPTVSADGWTTVPKARKARKKVVDPYKGFAKISDFRFSCPPKETFCLLDVATITEGGKKPFPQGKGLPTRPPRFPPGKPRAFPRGPSYKKVLVSPPKAKKNLPKEDKKKQVETPVDYESLLVDAVKKFDSLDNWLDNQPTWKPWVNEAYHFLNDLDKSLLKYIPDEFLNGLSEVDYRKVREIPGILNAIDAEFPLE